ncbi:SusC/RagA family TonB-linked outer membrane protein [Niabella pedocola]|uniref:SusC/RagA family TonB-linked outer membrane protein n=1 Tax=Niabella pedocola TaxID=1752077 RepID=A0ABS8PXE8_9BACT|nr:SusC/RagA family TonB-linked outer membrane protein [Niabella pedocola]MCD2425731.1 SusC/RagA family TonB-linked outer membrane protein [Niabella pedocola]
MRKLVLLLALVTCSMLVFAQTRTITGTVKDESGNVIPFATVSEKGAKNAVSADADGNFTMHVKDGATITISAAGFNSVDKSTLENLKEIVLNKEGKETIEEVVVTAVGVRRAERSLGYASTQVNAEELTATGNRSALNALQGKVPGVEITSGSGAPGASTRIIMRGFSSLGGSNQPLFVVDGVPVSNGQVGSTDLNGGLDFGNRGNDINPNDIESINILQGGSATALYGSRAASGVVLITTKNGSKSNGKASVDIASATSFETPLRLPFMQNEFGQGWYNRSTAEGGDLAENGSWGPRFDGVNRPWGFVVDNQQLVKPFSALKTNVRDFFEVGKTLNNSIAIKNGDENKSYYVSYGNILADGIMPTDADSYKRHNVALRGNTKFLKIFNASASVNYVNKSSKFVLTGQDQSVLDGLWQAPRDISFVDQKDYHNKFYNVDNYYTLYAQNPYYVLNEHGNRFEENRVFGNLSLDAKVTPWLTATFKAGNDVSGSTSKSWRAITKSARSASNDDVGRVTESSYSSSEFNTDFFLNIKPTINHDLTLDAIVGHNFNQRDARTHSSQVIGLDIPFFYSLSNSSATPSTSATLSKRRLVGVYGSANLGFKNMLFLNITGRNDWSSTLPASNRSFFYPGASLSFVFSELLQNKDVLSFGKIRMGAARTGKDADPYQIFAVLNQTALTDGYRGFNFPLAGGINGFTVSNLIGNQALQPEISTDYEIGTDLKFLKNRIGLNFTAYNKIITNLIWTSTIPSSTGFTAQTQNLGKITNKGVEIALNLVPVQTNDWNWEVFANYSRNKNKLEELVAGLDQISLGGTGSIGFVARPGYPLGLFEGTVVETDPQGRVVVNAQGLPNMKAEKEVLGSSQNKFRIGGGTTLSYKNWSMRLVGDYRNGGLMYSRTAEMMYFTGNAIQTTFNDRQPFIVPNSVQKVGNAYVENTTPIAGFDHNLNAYFNQTNNAGVGSSYVLMSKTFFKLREFSLYYSFPKEWISRSFIRSVDLGLIGTNLLLWTPTSNPFTDPEQTTFGNDMAADYGDYGAAPTTRSIGFNLKLGF